MKDFNKPNIDFFINKKTKNVYNKIFLVFIVIIYFINVFGFYPILKINYFYQGIIFLIFFSFLILYEKIKKNYEKKYFLKNFFVIFLIYLCLLNISGYKDSILKWYIIFFIIFIYFEFSLKYSIFFLFLFLLGIIKSIIKFSVDDYLLFISLIGLIGYFYFKSINLKEQFSEKMTRLPELVKDINEFKFKILNLLNNYIELYYSIIKPVSLLFLLRNFKNEENFYLFSFVSKYKDRINQSFTININDILWGKVFEKNDSFLMDVKHINLPYYIQPVSDIKKIITKPIIKNKVIGGFILDFDIEIKDYDNIISSLEKLNNDILNILSVYEIGNFLYEKEQQISKLNYIYEKLNILEGKEKVMDYFFDEIKTFNIESGYIAEFNYEKNKFIIIKSFGYKKNLINYEIAPDEDEILKYVFESKKKIIVDNIKQKNIKLNFENSQIDCFYMGILNKKNSIYGFIKLDKRSGYKFNEFEIKTLENILSSIIIIFENAALYENIIKQATHDGLTGLLNHITFENKLMEDLGKCDRKELLCVSVVIMDIDNFKKFNDTFGHQEGDRVLKKVGLMLKEFEKKYENTWAARYGGEEFVFIMENYDILKANQIAEEIRNFCENNLYGGNETTKRKITLSMGISVYPDYAKTYRDLIRMADEYLYLAKKNGKNQVRSILSEK